jgi:hypothetical protein
MSSQMQQKRPAEGRSRRGMPRLLGTILLATSDIPLRVEGLGKHGLIGRIQGSPRGLEQTFPVRFEPTAGTEVTILARLVKQERKGE